MIILLFFFGVGIAFFVFLVGVILLGNFLMLKRWIMGQPIRGRRDPRWYR